MHGIGGARWRSSVVGADLRAVCDAGKVGPAYLLVASHHECHCAGSWVSISGVGCGLSRGWG